MPFLPDVLMLGQFPLTTTAVTGLAGGLLAYLLAGWLARRDGAVPDPAADVVANALIGAILGAKLLYVAIDLPSYLANPAALVVFPFGPLALPGGVAGAVASVAWGLRRQAGWRGVLDQSAGPLALGLAVALAGWHAPGSWAFAPAVAVAALIAMALSLSRPAPGTRAAQSAILLSAALVLADLARPGGNMSGLQLASAVAGTAAWLWLNRTAMKKDSGT